MDKKPVWIAGIARGHNSGVCLLKDGEVVFAIEEERLTRRKYDGGPLASMVKILEYTDKIDFLVVAHTQTLQQAGKIDFSGDDVYTGLARKLGLISRSDYDIYGAGHPQVIDLSHLHHKLHAACAFYRSGFDSAAALIIDGAGTFLEFGFYGSHKTFRINEEGTLCFETESIFKCDYPSTFRTLYKHVGVRGPMTTSVTEDFSSKMYDEHENDTHVMHMTENAGIVKAYEAVTEYCGFQFIEAGKTMGLFPYGKPNPQVPKIFRHDTKDPIADRQVIVPQYPNGANVNLHAFDYLSPGEVGWNIDVTEYDNRRDLAYAVQTETQEEVVKLIRKTVELTKRNKVVISGGYGLNCVANYHYLGALKDEDIEIYVEPVSNDAGTAMGAALYFYRKLTKDDTVHPQVDTLFEGPAQCYSNDDIESLTTKYNALLEDCDDEKVVDLLTTKNIVTIFQGKSENGPRALGNRSIIFDPTYEDGKEYVNKVKRREYFRPFAGSILEEYGQEWFDLRGMKNSPTMMYAVNCQPGIAEKIPSIIHVDGTCRIQTVNEKQNKNYYNLIKAFHKRTEIPIVFNTSFNLAGEPLVETLDDAVRTLANSEIEYLYLPEYKKLITLKND